MAHYSKFTIGTTRIDVGVTGNLGNGQTIVSGSNVNSSNFDLDNTSVKITAFISQDGNELSLVMWTPTMTNGAGGYDLGTAEIKMPEGFVIRSATGMRSQPGRDGGATGTVENMGKPENIPVNSDRKSAFITLPRSEILSVKFIKE